MGQIISRAIDLLLDYVPLPINIWIAAHVALWNQRVFYKGQTIGLVAALFFMLLLIAFAYERGYKKYFRFGREKYFFVVYALPIVFALVGFLYGTWNS